MIQRVLPRLLACYSVCVATHLCLQACVSGSTLQMLTQMFYLFNQLPARCFRNKMLIMRECMVWWSRIMPLAFLPIKPEKRWYCEKAYKNRSPFNAICWAWHRIPQQHITALDFDSNRLVKMKHVPNTIRGTEEMEALILRVLETNSQFRYLLIAMDSTSFYGVHTANYLSTSDL